MITAETGDNLKVTGRRREMAAFAPSPGKTPTRVPTRTPVKQNRRFSGWVAMDNPYIRGSNILHVLRDSVQDI